MSLTTTAADDFRSVVLRGRNVASFKFALAKSVLSLAETGATSASLEELAVPFSRELCAHMQEVDTQSTSAGSRFLDACRHFNAGMITHDELVTTTALLGFNNVIDAFHVVDSADVSTRFFHDERQQSLRGIRFTDELLALASDADTKTAVGGRSRVPVAAGRECLARDADPPARRCGSSTTDPAR